MSGAKLADAVAASSTRRGFLAKLGGAVLGLAGARALAEPREAEAFHFCGHIYTTDSCPHPTGLPRIDAKGFPLKASNGRVVDDLGRYIDATGKPVDDERRAARGRRRLPLAKATRTRICTATGEVHHFKPHIDGSWHRCCGGHVRKLVDCCGYVKNRINGDNALTGYCFNGRKVFCVMYYDTNVKC